MGVWEGRVRDWGDWDWMSGDREGRGKQRTNGEVRDREVVGGGVCLGGDG